MRNLVLTLTALVAAGCGTTPANTDAGSSAATDGAVSTDASQTDGGGTECVLPAPREPMRTAPTCTPDPPPVATRDCGTPASRMVVDVPASITASTTWECDKVYRLTTLTFVENDAVLTIEAGTRIVGGSGGAALIVSRGARLQAVGTREKPIVFTSSNIDDASTPAQPGDWGGVVLLGRASINFRNPDTGMVVDNGIEGVAPTEPRGRYGGTDDAYDCGTLKYVRIEYGGYLFGVDNELNGLTVGACGACTTLDYIQTHRGQDDGIEFFGGTVDLRHAVVTGTADDSLDYDLGYRGTVQFFIGQQHGLPDEDRGIEADNNVFDRNAMPRSSPTLSNLTLIGPGSVNGGGNDAIVFREGVATRLYNAIVTGWPDQGLRIQHTETEAGLATGDLAVRNSIFFDIGPTRVEYVNTDTACYEPLLAGANRVGVESGLPASATSITNPSFVPAPGSAAATGAATPPASEGLDATATYVGAVAPGDPNPWYSGWTRFGE